MRLKITIFWWFYPYQNRRGAYKSHICERQLIITGGNATEALHFEKVFLCQMALFIQPPVATALKFGSFFGRDSWIPAIFIDIINQILAVITMVRKHNASFYIYILQYRDGEIDFITLSFAKHQIDRIAISVCGRMDFGTGSSPTVPGPVWRPPFFALALYWWAWTIVASSYSSASRLSTRKILSRIPSSIHLRKWLYTEFQGP